VAAAAANPPKPATAPGDTMSARPAAAAPRGAGTAAAGAASTALQRVGGGGGGAAGAAPAAKSRRPALSAALRTAMIPAFVDIWLIDRDTASTDLAGLARRASLGGAGEDANPLKVTEAEAKEWVERVLPDGGKQQPRGAKKDALVAAVEEARAHGAASLSRDCLVALFADHSIFPVTAERHWSDARRALAAAAAGGGPDARQEEAGGVGGTQPKKQKPKKKEKPPPPPPPPPQYEVGWSVSDIPDTDAATNRFYARKTLRLHAADATPAAIPLALGAGRGWVDHGLVAPMLDSLCSTDAMVARAVDVIAELKPGLLDWRARQMADGTSCICFRAEGETKSGGPMLVYFEYGPEPPDAPRPGAADPSARARSCRHFCVDELANVQGAVLLRQKRAIAVVARLEVLKAVGSSPDLAKQREQLGDIRARTAAALDLPSLPGWAAAVCAQSVAKEEPLARARAAERLLTGRFLPPLAAIGSAGLEARAAVGGIGGRWERPVGDV
jgi:hypothetical protein